MWWPITGKVDPGGKALPGAAGRPVLDTAPFRFRAVPGDIERLNRRATRAPSAESGELYDITALSFRAYADARHDYRLTRCGSSFGLGFGPKVVVPRGVLPAGESAIDWLKRPGCHIAVPGLRTTAFMVLGLLLGFNERIPSNRSSDQFGGQFGERFIELPFDRVIPAVAAGRADAGLVIHEGQITFGDADLVAILDLGEAWQRWTSLPLPLGGNAIRRDLDVRFGPGTIQRVAALLRASIDHALAHREESIDYTMPFALVNDALIPRAGTASAHESLRDRADRYIKMYVNPLTIDMGPRGLAALERLLQEGHAAGLCPSAGAIDPI